MFLPIGARAFCTVVSLAPAFAGTRRPGETNTTRPLPIPPQAAGRRGRDIDSLWHNRSNRRDAVARGETMNTISPVLEIALGTLPLLATLFIHGAGMFFVQREFERRGMRIYRSGRSGQVFFAAMILAMLATHLVEIFVWAATLMVVDAIPIFRDAFYFVAGTYTTLGYAEGTLSRTWRLMGPMIAISGLFAFGWTTGILVSLVSQAYRAREEGAKERLRPASHAEGQRAASGEGR